MTWGFTAIFNELRTAEHFWLSDPCVKVLWENVASNCIANVLCDFRWKGQHFTRWLNTWQRIGMFWRKAHIQRWVNRCHSRIFFNLLTVIITLVPDYNHAESADNLIWTYKDEPSLVLDEAFNTSLCFYPIPYSSDIKMPKWFYFFLLWLELA